MIYFPTQESSPFLASRLGLKEASLRTSRFRRRGMRKMSVIAWRDVRGRRRPPARGGLLPVVRRPPARGGPTLHDMVHAAYGGVVYSRATPCGWPADAGGWTGGWPLDWWMTAGPADAGGWTGGWPLDWWMTAGPADAGGWTGGWRLDWGWWLDWWMTAGPADAGGWTGG